DLDLVGRDDPEAPHGTARAASRREHRGAGLTGAVDWSTNLPVSRGLPLPTSPSLALPAPPPVAAELGVPLSVLDLASVAEGATHRDALLRTEAVARQAEELGYHRLWVAEHHNMPAVASSAPDVLAAHLGAVTERIRLGSGGVMLPNHAPLVVAERFAMLEHLHPGRIDLG